MLNAMFTFYRIGFRYIVALKYSSCLFQVKGKDRGTFYFFATLIRG